ncbi:DoxX family protein [Cohnella silvisoli]|uniref:DoxX family protein n=1 Tax=Cohnella silvisoli TaxID=2873699 RepID=A0ABV1KY00_9BACL|nr:DoxX family protein [Cohnella silvisoli]MCD9021971.1 DoxX family protein [Cohnella silvisoli]
MHIVAIVIQSWLLVWMSFQAVSKIAGAKIQVELFETIRLPQWFRIVTGVIQLIGCAGLVIGYWYPGMAAWAGVWLGITMVFAILSHFRVKEPVAKAIPAIVTFALAVVVLILFADEMPNPLA